MLFMNTGNNGEDNSFFLLTAIEIAVLGGITNWMLLDSKKRKLFQLVVNIFISGFTGLLVGELCLHYKMDESWAFFLCGASGLSAESLLRVFEQNVLNRLQFMTAQQEVDTVTGEVKTSTDQQELLKQPEQELNNLQCLLGQILMNEFGVSENDILEALLNIENQPISEKLRIGEMLVKNGIIDKDTLMQSLSRQLEKMKNE